MEQYYYLMQQIENDEYTETPYQELEAELETYKWEFLGMENNGKTNRYRWQYQKKHTISVIVKNEDAMILEIIY